MRIIFLLLSVLASQVLCAQEASKLEITKSKVFDDKSKAESILAIHSAANGNVVTVRGSKRKYHVHFYDENFSELNHQIVDRERKQKFIGAIKTDDLLRFFTVYSPKKDERIVYSHTIDMASKNVTTRTLFEQEVEKKQSLFGSRRNHRTNFSVTPDGAHFAIATDNNRKNKNSHTIRVFEAASSKLVYQKSYQEGEEILYEHNDLFIDDDLNVYSLGKLFENGSRKKNKDGDANYEIVLNKIAADLNETLKIDLGQDMLIQSLGFSSVDGQFNLVGLYSENQERWVKGGCVFSIDKDALKVISRKSQVLPKQVYEDLYGEARADRKNKKKKELGNFDIDYILTDTAGNAYLIAEEFYLSTTYVANGMNGGFTRTTPNYDDILILKFDPTGKLEWGRSIFKRSQSPSYNAFIIDDQLHVLLNSGKNLTEKNDGRTKLSKGWFETTALYDIDFESDGEPSYNKIQDNAGNHFYRPYYGSFDYQRFVMISDGGTKKTFLTLE
ncbi:hypothetical protein [Nonlabens ponticola]|uniref:Uncharacterized protein n=1 Tax=Nonlabens ponticola TaxID=2496866 RepID=A0A3S9MXL2_9FLAO|nr:hypothetical protein [Nonlabens ponticola]AZQ43995.1 hypothetical protein EJ995_07015 [Nonlabens ponticola]